MPERILLALVLTAGVLDATAVYNTATFGIGLWLAISGLAGALLITRSFLLTAPGPRDGVPAKDLKPVVFFMAFIWAFAAVHAILQIGAPPMTLVTQTSIRTILAGHFLVCILLMRLVDSQNFLYRTVCVIAFLYVCYGLYDFGAQVLHLPRFLDFMRNSNSEKATEAMGAQGWIQLPRIMGFAGEPSHTMMPLALAAFVFARTRGFRRVVLLGMTTMFCVGTFARSVWIAYFGAALVAFGVSITSRMFDRGHPWVSRLVLSASAVCLPMLALAFPYLTNVGPDADSSVMKRVDSSRAGVSMFTDHPFLGVGFEGWRGVPFGFTDRLMNIGFVDYIHNGVSVYLAVFGFAGILIVYLPMLLLMRASNLSKTGKAWWMAIYAFSALGGEYLSLASTWTAFAVAICWNSQRAAAQAARRKSITTAPRPMLPVAQSG